MVWGSLLATAVACGGQSSSRQSGTGGTGAGTGGSGTGGTSAGTGGTGGGGGGGGGVTFSSGVPGATVIDDMTDAQW